MKIDLSSDDWKLITIKYSNKCCICQEEIKQGSKELWKKGEGVKHQSCVGMDKIEIPEEEKIQTKGKDGEAAGQVRLGWFCSPCCFSRQHDLISYDSDITIFYIRCQYRK